jgi:tyrosyl-tRNA synthetase
MDVERQITLLLRGTRFADEAEGGEAEASSLAETQHADDTASRSPDPTAPPTAPPTGPPTGRTLREQMTVELRERLKAGRPLRVYLGVDATARSLHIGHFVPLQKLRLFQKLGHQVIFLIGDYTTLIGDPTGRKEERQRITHEEILENAKDFARQAYRLLDPERTELRYNGEWLSKLSFQEIVEIASIFPLKWVVSRRDFRERMDRGEPLRFHETLYCLMQGYDAYALKCDVQIGAYDQHLNMLAGRWIQEHFADRPHIIWTFPLLPGTDGRKMSKSYGNTINITDIPDDMYGKCMRIADGMLDSYLDLTTDYEPEAVDDLKARLAQHGTNPMDVKKEVAFSLVRQYYDEATARAAADQFRSLVQEKEIPDEVPELRVPAELQGRPVPWPDLLAALTHEGRPLATSKGEVRRLMAQGGFYVEQEPIRDAAAVYEPSPSVLVRLGKRRYFRIRQ